MPWEFRTVQALLQLQNSFNPITVFLADLQQRFFHLQFLGPILGLSHALKSVKLTRFGLSLS